MANPAKSGASQFFLARKRQTWPLAGPPNWVGRGWMKKTVSKEDAWGRVEGGREAK
jgi:hypothetical protein